MLRTGLAVSSPHLEIKFLTGFTGWKPVPRGCGVMRINRSLFSEKIVKLVRVLNEADFINFGGWSG